MPSLSPQDFFTATPQAVPQAATTSAPTVKVPKGSFALAPGDFFAQAPHELSGGELLGGFAKETGKDVAREAATLADMVVGVPHQILGLAANLGRRGVSLGYQAAGRLPAGVTDRDIAKDAAEWQHRAEAMAPQPFKALVGMLSSKEEQAASTQTGVEKVIKKVMQVTDEGAEWIERMSNGQLLKEDVQALRDEALALVGGKATAAGAGALGRRLSKPQTPPVAEGPEGTGNLDKEEKAVKAEHDAAQAPNSAEFAQRTTAEGRAKSDIERVTGIADAEAAKAARRQTRASARAAFKDDAKYTAYLARFADGEAAMAAVAAGAATYAAVSGDEDEDHKAAVLATAGLALILGKGNMTVEELAKVPESTPLGAIRDSQPYTMKTLQRLSPTAGSFKKDYIEQELKRQDVTDAERGAVRAALAGVPGDRISARDLLLGTRRATGDFELTAKETHEYADYGLDHIQRGEGFDYIPEGEELGDVTTRATNGLPEAQATTTLYRLPEHMPVSDANHFGVPRLFGWTRSFEEGGVRHVVEIQSDLAQHARELSPAERTRIENDLAEASMTRNDWQQAVAKAQETYEQAIQATIKDRGGFEQQRTREKAFRTLADAKITLRDAELRVHELEAKLLQGDSSKTLSPILKNWPKRLVREELTRAREALDERLRLEQTYVEMGDPESEARAEDLKLSHSRSVRFATADTVAKVEGWPNRQEAYDRTYKGSREEAAGMVKRPEQPYSPAHQSIYDRYRGDIDKFLRQLGAKPYTDPHGHTWLEVPLPRSGPVQMFGRVEPKVLLGIAAVGLGLTVGARLDPNNPIEGAVLGAIAGALAVTGAVPRAVAAFRSLAKPDTRIRINGLTEARELAEKRAARATWQVQTALIRLLPRKADRVAVHRAIDEGKVAELKGNLRKAAEIAEKFYAGVAGHGLAADVLQDVVTNYTTHLWGKEAAKSGVGMAASTGFAKTRKFLTLAEGKAAGFTPLTEDIAEVLGIYGNTLGRTIANKTFLANLKSARGPQGERLVRALNSAPPDYVSIQHPLLQWVKVHPDIAPSLRFMFEAQTPGTIMAGLGAVNTAFKRVAVSFSLFHAKSLFDAALGAFRSPTTAVKFLGQALVPRVFGENAYLKALREGGEGDTVDFALQSGLNISFERADPVTEDVGVVGGGFYRGMQSLQKTLDAAVPHLGQITIGPIARLNHIVDNFTWGRLHTGMKLAVFASKVEALLENSAKAGKPLTREAAGRIAASYANDVFGGLNWQRIAEGTATRWGRDAALDLLSPKGRRATQLLVFAPDWTFATTRAVVKAVGRGGGLRGLTSARTLADLHRQQLIRSAFYYAMIGDGINYAMTGHHIWDKEQKDWTRVELGDGRTIQLSKHFTEPFHWVRSPESAGQQAMNKLAVGPRELATQFLGVEYLSAKGKAPPMKEGRLAHLAKSLNPIGVQQFRDSGISAGISGALGVPIYGKSRADKAFEKRKKQLLAQRAAIEKARKRLPGAPP